VCDNLLDGQARDQEVQMPDNTQ